MRLLIRRRYVDDGPDSRLRATQATALPPRFRPSRSPLGSTQRSARLRQLNFTAQFQLSLWRASWQVMWQSLPRDDPASAGHIQNQAAGRHNSAVGALGRPLPRPRSGHDQDRRFAARSAAWPRASQPAAPALKTRGFGARADLNPAGERRRPTDGVVIARRGLRSGGAEVRCSRPGGPETIGLGYETPRSTPQWVKDPLDGERSEEITSAA